MAELQTRFPIEIDLDELAGLQGWHLQREDLAAYVEGRMDELDLECAKLHLQECLLCEELVSACSEYVLEQSRSKRSARWEPIVWSRHIPGFAALSMPRLQLAAAAALIIVLLLTLWTVMRPKSQKLELAGDSPPETVVPDLPPKQSPVSVQPDARAGSDIGKKLDGPASDQASATASSRKGEARRNEDEFERALIAKNLTMPPSIEMLDRTPAIAIRGNRASSETFDLIGPVTTVIRTDRPTFSWTALNGATTYTVSVFDADLHLVRTSEPLTDTQWSMPDRLKTGTVYTWIVSALKDGREIVAPASPARAEFKILEKSELTRLNRLLRVTRSHAARGMLYAQAGLLDEAQTEFRTYLALRAVDGRVKQLLQIVRSWRGGPSSTPMK